MKIHMLLHPLANAGYISLCKHTNESQLVTGAN